MRKWRTISMLGNKVGLLPDSDLAVLYPFVVEFLHGSVGVKATVHVAQGRLVCRHLELDTDKGQIDRDVLHTLGLATMLRQAAGYVAFRSGTSDDAWSDPQRFDAGAIASDVKRYMKEHGPRRLNAAFLSRVADSYRKALKDGESTAVAVARLQQTDLGLAKAAPVATARRWIAAARRDHFLEPTTKGRKGG